MVPNDGQVTREAKEGVVCVFFFWNLYVLKGYLGGGFKYFLFSPLPGEDSQFD